MPPLATQLQVARVKGKILGSESEPVPGCQALKLLSYNLENLHAFVFKLHVFYGEICMKGQK